MIIDMHTHVLPGLDDGARDWETCLQMLLESAQCGVRKIIATPHYSPWDQNTTTERIYQLCKEAESLLKAQYEIEVEIYPGHEIYYHIGVVDELKEGKALTLAGSRYVLLEFDPETSYSMLSHAVHEVLDGGYIPIIAHMERYCCLRTVDKLKKLKEDGALFQINISAIQGSFLDAKSRWARTCLRKELIDFLASDMHNVGTREPLSSEKLSWVYNKLSREYQRKILCGNSQNIIADIREQKG